MKDNIKRIMQIIGKLRTIISKWPMSPVWKPLIFLLLLLAIEIFLMVLSANACNQSWTYANRYVAGWFLINIVIILCATILTILRPKKGLIFTSIVLASFVIGAGKTMLIAVSKAMYIANRLIVTSKLKPSKKLINQEKSCKSSKMENETKIL